MTGQKPRNTIDISTLSKLKEVYYIYTDNNDDTIHVEKRKIAYANKEYVYLIIPGKSELDRVRVRLIWDSFSDFLTSNAANDLYGCIIFCLRITDDQIKNAKEMIMIASIRRRIESYNQEIRDAEKLIDNLNRQIVEKKAAIANIKAMIEKLESQLQQQRKED